MRIISNLSLVSLHMKKIYSACLYVAISCLSTLTVFGQGNLMSNFSLETYGNCPTTLSQLTQATGWGQPTNHSGSPDYFNACQTNTTAGVPTNVFGSLNAAHGQAYAGGYNYLNNSAYREYVVGTLSQSLVAGQAYIVAFKFARASNMRFATDAYGFYLSSNWPSVATATNGNLGVTPTSTNASGNVLSSTSWSEYRDTIVAGGGEQYITIGSFVQNATGTLVSNSGISGSYMYVDSVVIVIYNGVFGDSNICLGDTAQIYTVLDTNHYWVDASNASVSLGTDDTLNVAPINTTTYWAITYNDTFAFTVNVHEPPTQFVGNDTSICEGDIISRAVDMPGYGYLWSDNGADSVLFTPDSGYHWLEVSIYGCSRRDSFHVEYHPFPAFSLIDDTTICHYDDYYLQTGLNSPLLFQWNTGASTPGITIFDTGTYAVTVTNEFCSYSDSTRFFYYPEISVDLGDDKVMCYTPLYNLSPTVSNANQYQWSTGSTASNINIATTNWYHVTVSNNGYCEATDSVHFIFHHEPVVAFDENEIKFCRNEYATLNPSVQASLPADYLWNNGATTDSLITNQVGLYWVEVSDQYCSMRDSVIVSVFPDLIVNLGLDQEICEGQSLELTATTSIPANQFNWNTGETGPSISVSEHGTYSVTASDDHCSDDDQINVFVLAYPEFDLGPAIELCVYDSVSLDIQQPSSNINYQWSNGSTQSHATFPAKDSTWIWAKANNRGCIETDSVWMTVHRLPNPELIPDTSICPDEELWLRVSDAAAQLTVTWNTGATGPAIPIPGPGEYTASVTDALCTRSATTTVRHKVTPQHSNLLEDLPSQICYNEAFPIDVSAPIFHAYQWEDGSTNPYRVIGEEGLYWVKAFHDCGVVKDSAEIDKCECPVWTPTAFHPDGTDQNEVFLPKLDCNPVEYELKVYDRWGELIYATNDPNAGWDGLHLNVPVQGGAYAWILTYTVMDEGVVEKGEKTGSVLLLR